MPLSRKVLERQIELAKGELSAWVEHLSKTGVNRSEFRKNAKWRTLNAKWNQIQRRLDSLAKVEANDVAVAQRKTERDGDADVDEDDMAMFAKCQSGPSIPADPNCRNR